MIINTSTGTKENAFKYPIKHTFINHVHRVINYLCNHPSSHFLQRSQSGNKFGFMVLSLLSVSEALICSKFPVSFLLVNVNSFSFELVAQEIGDSIGTPTDRIKKLALGASLIRILIYFLTRRRVNSAPY